MSDPMRLIFITFLIVPFTSLSQYLNSEKIEELSKSKLPKVITEFRELLAIPNDANYELHVEENAKWMKAAFKKRNFTVQVLNTNGPDVLLASRTVKNPAKTVMFYLHIDGQPVDSSKWFQDSPYEPVLKTKVESGWEIIGWENVEGEIDPEWRVFARSASDAKGPVVMFLGAIDIIDENDISSNFNIKVIMDFEEEKGSPNLADALEKYKTELESDMLVILDGPRHISNKPTLTFGARGITTITLTVSGPRVPQHSGHYGNYAPNPAFKLSALLSSMKDESGVVLIPGYYDGIEIDDKTRKILEAVPDDEDMIKANIGIAKIDGIATNYQEAIQYPSLNIRGMQSGWIGKQARTIIPATATAEIDVRLVKESSSDRLVGLIRGHISSKGYHFVDSVPSEDERKLFPNLISMTSTNSYGAFRTAFDSDIGTWLYSAMVRTFDEEPIRIRTSGGSIPIAPFVSTLGIPAVTVPNVNRDNNQHSPNENLRLGNLEEGIRICLAILSEPFTK